MATAEVFLKLGLMWTLAAGGLLGENLGLMWGLTVCSASPLLLPYSCSSLIPLLCKAVLGLEVFVTFSLLQPVYLCTASRGDLSNQTTETDQVTKPL